jgi:hypothetical protein
MRSWLACALAGSALTVAVVTTGASARTTLLRCEWGTADVVVIPDPPTGPAEFQPNSTITSCPTNTIAGEIDGGAIATSNGAGFSTAATDCNNSLPPGTQETVAGHPMTINWLKGGQMAGTSTTSVRSISVGMRVWGSRTITITQTGLIVAGRFAGAAFREVISKTNLFTTGCQLWGGWLFGEDLLIETTS